MIHGQTKQAESANAFAQNTAKAAPWWIALGVTGVAIAILTGKAPMLASLTLIGIGSDADLARRLREALEAEGTRAVPSNPAVVAGFVRRVHALMYLILAAFTWASLLHMTPMDESGTFARWWLAGDLIVAAVLAFGYARLARRYSGCQLRSG